MRKTNKAEWEPRSESSSTGRKLGKGEPEVQKKEKDINSSGQQKRRRRRSGSSGETDLVTKSQFSKDVQTLGCKVVRLDCLYIKKRTNWSVGAGKLNKQECVEATKKESELLFHPVQDKTWKIMDFRFGKMANKRQREDEKCEIKMALKTSGWKMNVTSEKQNITTQNG